MLYKGYDSYGYEEVESFVAIATQKNFQYPPVKNVETSVLDGDSFFTENGQPLVDLVVGEPATASSTNSQEVTE